MAIQIQMTTVSGGTQMSPTTPRAAGNASSVSAAPTRTPEPADPAVRRDDLTHALDAINRKMQEGGQNLKFSTDSDTGKLTVKIIDTATNQVIRQIPSDVAIAISRSLEKLQGLLLRHKA